MPDVKKVVFFSPFAFIWPHALPEHQLAQLLHDQGLAVKVIGCRKSYSTLCTAMEAAHVDVGDDQSVKDRICTRCIGNSEILKKAFRALEFSAIEDYPLDDVPEPRVAVPENPEQMLDCTVDGVEIGRIALYETLIKFKKFNMELSPVERVHFEASFLNALKVLRQATAVLRAEKPDVVVCYSPQYDIPGVFAAVAAREGIRTVFIEGSSNDVERYSHLRMWDWDTHGLSQPAISVPDRFAAYKLTAEGAGRARRLMDIRARAAAFSAYTSAARNASPYEVFGLDKNRKYILMAMSSYDEVYSGYIIRRLPRTRFEGRVFKNQIEWLKETIDWAAFHPEIQMVVRPHPREFPNKREGVSSPHVKEWAPILASLPPNVKIDHPDMKFSLYDHLEHADALVTGWSSVGVEALSKGLPVVTYDEALPTFPKSIHYSGSSKAEYFENILRALKDTDRERHTQDALRWLAYTCEVGTVRIGGRFNDRFPIFTKLKARRYLREFGSRWVDVLFPPAGRDVGRVLGLVRGEGMSLFELPE